MQNVKFVGNKIINNKMRDSLRLHDCYLSVIEMSARQNCYDPLLKII
jgi:hypothetical protein